MRKKGYNDLSQASPRYFSHTVSRVRKFVVKEPRDIYHCFKPNFSYDMSGQDVLRDSMAQKRKLR